jgi:hypothetical protein
MQSCLDQVNYYYYYCYYYYYFLLEFSSNIFPYALKCLLCKMIFGHIKYRLLDCGQRRALEDRLSSRIIFGSRLRGL